MAIVRAGPSWIFAAVLGLLLATVIAWIVTSALWPAKADRRCPACGRKSLERMTSDSTRGLACKACGHVDPSASGWFLAEEEGPLEELVLRERNRSRRRDRTRS